MKKERKSSWQLQIFLGIVIIVIIIICVVKLIKWDKSGDNVVMEDIAEGTYDYESLDVVFTVDKDILESHGYDDVNTILCIGNDIFSEKPNDVSIIDMISKMDDVEVVDLSVVSSQVTDKANSYSSRDVSVWQAANLFEIVYALCNNDFSLQQAAAEQSVMIDADYCNKLSSVNMDEIDTVYIMYDSCDYRFSSILYDPEDPYNTATYEGAYRAAVTTLQNAYPHLRIILGSPYMHAVILDENVKPASEFSFGNGNLSEYVMRQYNIAMECCISYEDNYFGLITEKNMNDYCNVNMLSDDGLQLIGKHIVEFLQRKY